MANVLRMLALLAAMLLAGASAATSTAKRMTARKCWDLCHEWSMLMAGVVAMGADGGEVGCICKLKPLRKAPKPPPAPEEEPQPQPESSLAPRGVSVVGDDSEMALLGAGAQFTMSRVLAARAAAAAFYSSQSSCQSNPYAPGCTSYKPAKFYTPKPYQSPFTPTPRH